MYAYVDWALIELIFLGWGISSLIALLVIINYERYINNCQPKSNSGSDWFVLIINSILWWYVIIEKIFLFIMKKYWSFMVKERHFGKRIYKNVSGT